MFALLGGRVRRARDVEARAGDRRLHGLDVPGAPARGVRRRRHAGQAGRGAPRPRLGSRCTHPSGDCSRCSHRHSRCCFGRSWDCLSSRGASMLWAVSSGTTRTGVERLLLNAALLLVTYTAASHSAGLSHDRSRLPGRQRRHVAVQHRLRPLHRCGAVGRALRPQLLRGRTHSGDRDRGIPVRNHALGATALAVRCRGRNRSRRFRADAVAWWDRRSRDWSRRVRRGRRPRAAAHPRARSAPGRDRARLLLRLQARPRLSDHLTCRPFWHDVGAAGRVAGRAPCLCRDIPSVGSG